MKEFTQEMYETLKAANDHVKGTSNYAKYYMPHEFKHNGRWRFSLWCIPCKLGEIKKVKNKMYIMFRDEHGTVHERCEITEDVKALLSLD